MIKEADRRDILERRKIMRRHLTLYQNARDNFHSSLQYAHSRGATPTELAKLVNLSFSRIKQIVSGRAIHRPPVKRKEDN